MENPEKYDSVPRYLITSADERTWKFDRPVLFLGEWCRRYDRKHIWQDMDAIIAEPYGLDKAQKDSDHARVLTLEEKLFPVLCDVLNQYHGTQHKERFWRIVLGHWFRRYVDVILNRVRTLEQCRRSYQLNGMTVISVDHYKLAPLTSYEAIWAFNDDGWNSALYIRILNLLGDTHYPVEAIAGDETEGFRWTVTVTDESRKQKILKRIYQKLGKLAGFLARKDDAFIINSYLPKKELVRFNLALMQVPQFYTSPELEKTKSQDHTLRHYLSDQLRVKTNDTLFGIMCSLVFELIPVCYLEGFPELTEKVQQLPWPKKPKFIFTSNNFDTDEVFKLWVATRTEAGYKYVIGQHGNHYGTFRYLCPSIEEATSDKFLTWGWADGLPQHTPAFIVKTAGCNDEVHNSNGGLLLIEDVLYHQMDTWDRSYEFEIYIAEQFVFVEELQKRIRQELTVRLHPICKHTKSFEANRWNDFDTNLKINAGVGAINKLISQSRLVVHGYDSTGILETLSQNIPTLAFWQNNFDHLRDSAIPYYQLLVDAGIVHLTPESVAMKVNEVWEDVEGWWAGDIIQYARNKFCSRYGKVSQNPVRDLKKIFSSNIL